ncbi:MAG TPA: nickel pincer cofactor biosynthesis protein LarB [Polyangiaceae bacterium]|nr:nickel pincer cofactor biosynthesis protein LarB [Polyangiaceae bacterium]
MGPERLRNLLERVRAGALGVNDALHELEILPFEDIDYARVDHHRQLRQGVPEVIFGEGKTTEQIIGIAERLLAAGQGVLVTRLAAESAPKLLAVLPELRHNPIARTAWVAREPAPRVEGPPVVVVTAGTSDLPVAEEALVTLECAGIPSERLVDVGVAGLHRLLEAVPLLRRARAVIVIAGMEGALPSVVGGLVAVPVVAVPTSNGYGAALGGLTALFGMLTSCAAGVTVVNIDNGFGAAMAVARLVQSERAKERA